MECVADERSRVRGQFSNWASASLLLTSLPISVVGMTLQQGEKINRAELAELEEKRIGGAGSSGGGRS